MRKPFWSEPDETDNETSPLIAPLCMTGKLGHGSQENEPVPKMVSSLLGLYVTDVACGTEHTVICLKNGDVYTFGLGSDARLGHGDKQSVVRPKLVQSLHDRHIHVHDVAAAGRETVLKTETGDILTFGTDDFYVADTSEIPHWCLGFTERHKGESATGGET